MKFQGTILKDRSILVCVTNILISCSSIKQKKYKNKIKIEYDL